jgi:hypothetical protein
LSMGLRYRYPKEIYLSDIVYQDVCAFQEGIL